MPSSIALEKARIEALSDGVFAIAMTLLVLKLEVPPVMHHSSNLDMLRELLAMTPGFVTYVVTFLVAGWFWYLHHLSFHFIRHVDGALIWTNLVLLMFVSLLPFSAGLMSHLLVHPVTQLFYFGNLLAIALVLNFHLHYAKHRGLFDADRHVEMVRLTYRIGTAAAGFTAGVLTALFLPHYSLVAVALVLLGGWIIESYKRSRRAMDN